MATSKNLLAFLKIKGQLKKKKKLGMFDSIYNFLQAWRTTFTNLFNLSKFCWNWNIDKVLLPGA